ncbi:helix-turn-helix domain-containing protein [Streptomyces sp. NPDC020875]|uniref:helix-turn-helix domain-containing protein n=1 Tax=Streptomyces sp. NPDC020875 TaxID=3154898 RepID=UPI0033C7C43F
MSAGSVAVVVPEVFGVPSWDLYELSIPCTVFGKPQPDLADPWYELRICGTGESAESAESGSADPALGGAGAAGFQIRTAYGLDGLIGADTVIVPSVPDACVDGDQPVSPALVEALRSAHGAGARVVSLCNGAFALAAAGLLDGRRATCHWMHTARLAELHPRVEVDDSVLYVDDGDVLTSAGLAAGLDLCLHLVRRDLGARIANQLARRMVVPAHRPGGQAQFIDLPLPPEDDAGLAPVLDWVRENLDRPLTVAELARRASMSQRTFYRRLQAATGTTPLQWLLAQRLGRARVLLESTDLPVEKVGELSGLGTANNLRHHFLRHVGVTPGEYRRAFPRAARPAFAPVPGG